MLGFSFATERLLDGVQGSPMSAMSFQSGMTGWRFWRRPFPLAKTRPEPLASKRSHKAVSGARLEFLPQSQAADHMTDRGKSIGVANHIKPSYPFVNCHRA